MFLKTRVWTFVELTVCITFLGCQSAKTRDFRGGERPPVGFEGSPPLDRASPPKSSSIERVGIEEEMLSGAEELRAKQAVFKTTTRTVDQLVLPIIDVSGVASLLKKSLPLRPESMGARVQYGENRSKFDEEEPIERLMDPWVLDYKVCSVAQDDSQEICFAGKSRDVRVAVPIVAPKLRIEARLCSMSYGKVKIKQSCSKLNVLSPAKSPHIDESNLSRPLLERLMDHQRVHQAWENEWAQIHVVRYLFQDYLGVTESCSLSKKSTDFLHSVKQLLKISPPAFEETFHELSLDQMSSSVKNVEVFIKKAVATDPKSEKALSGLGIIDDDAEVVVNDIYHIVNIIYGSLGVVYTGYELYRWNESRETLKRRHTVTIGSDEVTLVRHLETGSLVIPTHRKKSYDAIIKEKGKFYLDDPRSKQVILDKRGKPVSMDLRKLGVKQVNGRFYAIDGVAPENDSHEAPSKHQNFRGSSSKSFDDKIWDLLMKNFFP